MTVKHALKQQISNTSTCCSKSRGARLFSRSCFLRYEFYAFYEDASKSSTENQRIFAKESQVSGQEIKLHEIGDPNKIDVHHQNLQARDNLNSQNFPFMDLVTLSAATDNFSASNKFGQGGFGPVYKGQLLDGREVAVKRLSSCSEQGLDEFTNEVLLILKLQHKNLVRLLGFCIDGEEKLLIYEYMPNGSLDVFLFGLFFSYRQKHKRVNIRAVKHWCRQILLEESRLSELGIIVIDELHLVGDQNRGYLLELMLTKLRCAAGEGNIQSSSGESSGPSSGKTDPSRGLQIFGMTATLPSVAAVADWLRIFLK